MMMLVVYYIISTVILNMEMVVATDQCSVYEFKSPFHPGESCEDVYNMNPESRDLSGYYWILDGPSKVFCGMNYTGSSCLNIYSNNPETGDKSGYYRIDSTQWTYCNMTRIATDFISTCAGVGGGWRRIANINVTAGDHCPSGWHRATHSGVSFCYKGDTGVCSSTFFSTNGTSYQRVCGRARGYQKGNTIGFRGSQNFFQTINDAYADSLGIHYGSPRQHIWSYVSGLYDNTIENLYNCPCAVGSGPVPPSFVGTNFYCESAGANPRNSDNYYFNDILWDGSGCPTGTCCNDTTQPWFYRELNGTTTSDIEARLCSHEVFSNRAVIIDQLELYIQ
ncbi:uncharacterized protein [Dysidea avara]|uniref:uncharacterized protein n=1 Tax=Dysidea avara TaxID=196820 RepID=UPI003324021C